MIDPANLTPFYTYALCDSLAKNNCKVSFYSTEYDNDLSLKSPDSFEFFDHYFKKLRNIQRNGNKTLRKLCRGLSYYFDHRSAANKIIENKTDVVHIQWAMLPLLDIKFILKLKNSGIAVILTVHDADPLFPMGSLKNITSLYQLVDAIVVHNQTAAADILRIYPSINANNIHIIPHGPLQAQDIPTGKTQDDARSALGIPVNADVICFFGEIKHYKGLDYLVDACLKLKSSRPDLFLLIAGKPGDESDIPDLSPLIQKNIQYRADFGFVANDDVWKYYLAADIIALPYRQISQSGVLFSALAHERYVICSNVGALPEILDEVGGGCTFPKGEVSLLAEMIDQKLEDKTSLFSDAKRAKNNMDKLYNWPSIAEKTIQLYRSLAIKTQTPVATRN